MLRVSGALLKNSLYLADLSAHLWHFGAAVIYMFRSHVSRFPMCSSGFSFLLSEKQEIKATSFKNLYYDSGLQNEFIF